MGVRDETNGFVTGLHTAHLNFNEHMLIKIVNYYEAILKSYSEVETQ